MSIRRLGKILDNANMGLNAMEQLPCEPRECDPSVNVFCRPCCVSMALNNIKFLTTDEIHEIGHMTDEEFRKMIYEVAPDDKTQREFAEAFQVSVPTIKRWASGANSPHPYMRQHVKEFVEEWKKRCEKAT